MVLIIPLSEVSVGLILLIKLLLTSNLLMKFKKKKNKINAIGLVSPLTHFVFYSIQ